MTLHVAVSGWLLGPHSGANRRLLALCERLAPELDAGERVTVLHRPDYAPPALPRIEWRAIEIPTGPAFRRARAEARLLPAVLRELGATVLDHGFLPLPRVAVPTCLLLHDLRAAEGLTRWPRWLARAVLRRSCQRAAAIVVPSEFTAQRLRALVAPVAPVHVVPNGVVLPPPHRGVGREHLLHVGHIEPRKNLGVVLRALALLPAVHRPPLYLVGKDAGSLAGLHALATQLGIPDSLQWCGVRDDAATAELYATARAVVVPSRYEGFGLCALEGLAHGRPVLVADAGALPEVVGTAGVVLPPGDPAAWARAIEALTAPRAATATSPTQRAPAWGWPAAARALISAYRSVQ